MYPGEKCTETMYSHMQNVMLLDNVDPVCGELLRQNGFNVTQRASILKEELQTDLKGQQALIVRSATKVTADLLDHASDLLVVGRAGTGVDNIDIKAATRKGILVMNTPAGNAVSAAEHTCALICALARSVPLACASLKGGFWDRKKFMGNELYGKTLAVIGLGRIGREVSVRMKSFGMKVIGYDPLVSAEAAAEWGIEFYSLEELWSRADYITVHTPLIPETRNLINASVFAKCKPTVRVVNVARGGIIDESALLDALENGQCGGAALDVFEEEPPRNTALCQHSKVICTPHLGANTVEAQFRVAEEVARNLVDIKQGKQLTGVVNAPSLTSAASSAVCPWLKLGRLLGSLLASFCACDNLRGLKISVLLHGPECTSIREVMEVAVLTGVMEKLRGGANMVNSPMLAEENGVTISAACSNDSPFCDHLNIVDVQFLHPDGMHKAVGLLLGDDPALIEVDDFVFQPPILLMSCVSLLKASQNPNHFTFLASELKNDVISIQSSAVKGKEALYAVRTKSPIKTDTVSVVAFCTTVSAE